MGALWSIEDLHPLHIDRHWEREVYILNMARTATFCTAMNQANFIQPLFSAFQLWTKSNATPSCVFPLDFCFVLSHLMHFFMNSWTLLHNWNGQNFTCGCFFSSANSNYTSITFSAKFNSTATKPWCQLQCFTFRYTSIKIDLYVFVHFSCNFWWNGSTHVAFCAVAVSWISWISYALHSEKLTMLPIWQCHTFTDSWRMLSVKWLNDI